MAENETESVVPSEGGAKKKGLPIKMIVIVLALMSVEAVAVFVVLGKMAGPPEVKAEGLADDPSDELEQIRELLIVDDRFPNHQSGRVWLWQTEIQMQVRQKNLAYAQRVLEERSAEIKTGVAQIVRTSHHKHLTEPNLDTLNRQIEEYLRDVFEYDATGESRVERVLIPKCTGVPADF